MADEDVVDYDDDVDEGAPQEKVPHAVPLLYQYVHPLL
jgi:hypothetical protein